MQIHVTKDEMEQTEGKIKQKNIKLRAIGTQLWTASHNGNQQLLKHSKERSSEDHSYCASARSWKTTIKYRNPPCIVIALFCLPLNAFNF